MKKYFLYAIVALIIVSCSKDNDTPEAVNEEEQFVAQVNRSKGLFAAQNIGL